MVSSFVNSRILYENPHLPFDKPLALSIAEGKSSEAALLVIKGTLKLRKKRLRSQERKGNIDNNPSICLGEGDICSCGGLPSFFLK
ncbi:MAG: hypothetical protein DRH11_06510 [Deltaproteobacteria bacterium]|nr:MAG: hypothetical protein DRH11_06510 [Deltaproteobacteria bacterium]